ncbi:MAG: histidinol dehydrogenase [Deltaproteobacteria bacterium]|nr:histidinol dehydrogenase [Deltaproteobacteria bacterium]MBW1961504.1 histidinol dehydrogenase [Deltaproteobacteria bacterium]MBW2150682.1 histidinol dehydrogenase [Deltaproteobacteria bacterium]
MKIFTYPSKTAEKKISSIINRNLTFKKKDIAEVTKIIDSVKKKGDTALIEYVNRFDAPHLTIEELQVSSRELKAALGHVEGSFLRALNRAARQITTFHQQQLQRSWIDTRRAGTILGQMITPVDTVGLYVPGGTGGQTPLVSTVLMGAIPARVAGVNRIVMATPPRRDGTVNPHLLVAAKKAGVTEIYKIGSAWAIGAMAFGTRTIPKADMIVGPGNIYVALAKRIVAGAVGIDMFAGPSEILIVADTTAIPRFIAADLLSQAEHDPLSSAILVTDSIEVATAVESAIDSQLKQLPRGDIARKSIASYGAIFTVPDLECALELANRIAPEHLELQIKDPFACIGRIRNAGAIFLGNYTPESIGDYMAGPNHVLPTGGTARFASALSVDHFVKKTSLIHYTYDAFKREASDTACLARIEGLDAHAMAVQIRIGAPKKQDSV